MTTGRIEFKERDSEMFKALIARQGGRCAFTNEPLNETMVLHHVVPASHGGVRNASTEAFVSDWRRNGVLVNEEPELGVGKEAGAHLATHGGSFRNGVAADHVAFRYSHGDDLRSHEQWARDGEAFVRTHIFPDRDQAHNQLMQR